MKLIISSTNRKNSRTFTVSQIVSKLYQDCGERIELLDLKEVLFKDFITEPPYSQPPPPSLKPHIDKVSKAEGLIFVCPEYNGSFPGPLKLFIDHWPYPECFQKPICFIGVAAGGFGGKISITHLRHIFSLGFILPNEVCISHITKILKDGRILDENINQRLKIQTQHFIKFVEALKTQSFH